MSAVNPATGEPLPADALQRVLFVTPLVHVYSVPPLTSMKGYSAAEWTVPNPQTGQTRQIFSARLRILETAIHDKVSGDILLEDPQNGTLFAAAPLTDANSVDYVTDSSRFFVLRVVGEGRKALLGIGFEERSDAFDFGVALQEAKKILGIRDTNSTEQQKPTQSWGQANNSTSSSSALEDNPSSTAPKDYSLKPGQTISIAGSRRRPVPTTTPTHSNSARDEEQALFSIPPPPPPGAATSFINTATSSDQTGRRKRPTSAIIAPADTKPFLGFDDSANFD